MARHPNMPLEPKSEETVTFVNEGDGKEIEVVKNISKQGLKLLKKQGFVQKSRKLREQEAAAEEKAEKTSKPEDEEEDDDEDEEEEDQQEKEAESTPSTPPQKAVPRKTPGRTQS